MFRLAARSTFGLPIGLLRRRAVLGHGLVALLCLAQLASGQPQAQGNRVDVRILDARLSSSTVVQGDPFRLSYRVEGNSSALSATVFLRVGALEQAPVSWHEGAVRVEPQYQLSKAELAGTTKELQCTLGSGTTRNLSPGVHTVFVAVTEPGKGWQTWRLGELKVLPFDHIDVPALNGKVCVAIWPPPSSALKQASTAATLAAAAQELGYTVSYLSTAQLMDSQTFDRSLYEVLVLDYGIYPIDALPAIERFLRQAGALIQLDGPPLAWPVGSTPDAAGTAPPRQVFLPDQASVAQLAAEHGPKTTGSIRYVDPQQGVAGAAIEVTVPELEDWFYVCLPLDRVRSPEHAYLAFKARGDGDTDKLCLELTEDDGSRWKYFVKLTHEWREYTVSMVQFAAYANPARSDAFPFLDPSRCATLKLGFYRRLYDDERPRTFRCATIRLLAAPDDLAMEFPFQHLADWAPQYAYLKARSPCNSLGLIRDLRRVDGIRQLCSGAEAAEPGSAVLLEHPLTGWDVVPATARGETPKRGLRVCSESRHITTLTARDEFGTPLGTVGGLIFTYRGPFRGSACAWLSLDRVSIGALASEHPGVLKSTCKEILERIGTGVYLLEPRPVFEGDGEALTGAWQVNVANVSGADRHVDLEALSSGGDQLHRCALDLASGEVRAVRVPWSWEEANPAHFGLVAKLLGQESLVDELHAHADARKALEAGADWMISGQAEEGNFSPYFYADVYSARTLAVLSLLTGYSSYRSAALRLIDMLIRKQRPDGGWWVGYGQPEECVFVADDGCIALGLVQLARYMDPRRRSQCIEAARRFNTFRESFRITADVVRSLKQEYGAEDPGVLLGGLGIGYVRHDYFADKALGETRREMRQRPWTLHCSLAFLGALSVLDPAPPWQELALQDTRWFLARIEEGRDSVWNPYANEAVIWLHDTLTDAALKAALEKQLRTTFLTRVAQSEDDWWTASQGRGALLLPGLVYCHRSFTGEPAVKAALLKALWALCYPESPTSIHHVVEYRAPSRRSDAVMYVCFSSLGLAEVLSPRSTLLPRLRPSRP